MKPDVAGVIAEYKTALKRKDKITPRTPEEHRAFEAAREAMVKALGYERVHDHLGEFCNLHERDIPGYENARQEGPDAYRFSGYSQPVTAQELRKLLWAARQRASELEAWFQTPASERFLAGDCVIFKTGEGGREMWRRATYTHMRILLDKPAEFIGWEPVNAINVTPEQAAEWFSGQVNPIFVKGS